MLHNQLNGLFHVVNLESRLLICIKNSSLWIVVARSNKNRADAFLIGSKYITFRIVTDHVVVSNFYVTCSCLLLNCILCIVKCFGSRLAIFLIFEAQSICRLQ